jgi:hypothetical protein
LIDGKSVLSLPQSLQRPIARTQPIDAECASDGAEPTIEFLVAHVEVCRLSAGFIIGSHQRNAPRPGI